MGGKRSLRRINKQNAIKNGIELAEPARTISTPLQTDIDR